MTDEDPPATGRRRKAGLGGAAAAAAGGAVAFGQRAARADELDADTLDDDELGFGLAAGEALGRTQGLSRDATFDVAVEADGADPAVADPAVPDPAVADPAVADPAVANPVPSADPAPAAEPAAAAEPAPAAEPARDVTAPEDGPDDLAFGTGTRAARLVVDEFTEDELVAPGGDTGLLDDAVGFDDQTDDLLDVDALLTATGALDDGLAADLDDDLTGARSVLDQLDDDGDVVEDGATDDLLDDS